MVFFIKHLFSDEKVEIAVIHPTLKLFNFLYHMGSDISNIIEMPVR